ncbi:mitochondrial inner membrane protease subunit 1 [Onthophagus taurus]|uniref:mitochondrial inner membrane protease subunit 1 n=1 Tax=Onthophagus taurus TaxID=166361 RepID=UPI000C20BC31|nr:mitochondrial inner membrane protease subunit 1 [Onthophagus taurus]
MQTAVSKLVGTFGYIIQYGCIAHCTFEYLADLVVCSGPSMEPTLYSDNVLLTEHISPRLNMITRGDIVVAKCPTNPNQKICKRVVGVSGDKIRTGLKTHIIPRGHVWLEGDNRHNSADSRHYGPVPTGLIKSRAIVKIWPLNEVQVLKD